jgi:hypothetical protein
VSSDWPSACLPFFKAQLSTPIPKMSLGTRISLRTLFSANSGLQLVKGEIFIADFFILFLYAFLKNQSKPSQIKISEA